MNGDFQIGTRLVQPSLNLVRDNGTSTRLEPKVMQVLLCLAEHSGQVLPKEQLLRKVWPDTFVSDYVLSRAVSELRRALDDDARHPQVIQTIAKKGYRLLAPVRWLEDAAPDMIAENLHIPETTPQLGDRRTTQANPAETYLGEDASRTKRNLLPRSPVFKAGLAVLVIAVTAGVTADITRLRERKQHEALAASVRSIAVLPLANLSSNPEQEYLSEGLTDALITELSQMGELKVISRTTSMRYKGVQKPLPEIAHDLGVDGIVEGTVQRAGKRVRVTAQLVYAPADRNLWARSYERDLQDSLQLEEEIAASIAQEIRVQLSSQQQARLKQDRHPNPEALDNYLRGRYHLSRIGRGTGTEEAQKAITYFKQAIAEDANFAPAYTWLAETYDSSFSGSTAEIMPLEKAALSKALQLDPNSAKSHQLLGCIHFFYDWNWAEAEAEFKRSLELDPNSAWTHDRYSLYLAVMGRSEQAVAEAERARALDPSGPYGEYLSEVLGFLGRYDEAIEATRKYLELYPNDGFGHWNLFHWYAAKDLQRDAISELELTWKLFGFPDVARDVHDAQQRSGYRAALRTSVRALENLYARRTLWVPEEIARSYRFMGEKEQALQWLHTAYEERDGGVVFLRGVVWAPLQSDPRFQDLVRKIGLPQ